MNVFSSINNYIARILLLAEIVLVSFGKSGTEIEYFLPMFFLSGLTFVFAYIGNFERASKIIKTPFFWTSVALLAFLCIQCINFSAEVVQYVSYSKTESLKSSWLPSSVKATFESGNAFVSLMEYASMAFLIGTCVILFKRRKFLILLLWIIGFVSSCVAVIALYQYFYKVPIIVNPDSSVDIYGTIYLTNAAADFFNISCGVSMALIFYFAKKRKYILIVFPIIFVCLCSTATVFSECVAGIALLCIQFAGMGFLLLIKIKKRKNLFATIALISCCAVVFPILKVSERFKQFDYTSSQSIDSRIGFWRDTLTFEQQNVLFGHGGKSFQYKVTPYIVKKQIERNQKVFKAPIHPHSSILSAYVEVGLLGCAMIALLIVFWLKIIVEKRHRLKNCNFILLWSLICCTLHSIIDLSFVIPTVFLLFAIVAVASISNFYASSSSH